MERSKNNSFNENNKLDFRVVGLKLAFICMIPPETRIQLQVSIALLHMKYRELITNMFSVHAYNECFKLQMVQL